MTTPTPFTPDDDYCAYCHAPAAGPCAMCGASCCGDCAELKPGLTRQVAICRDCVAKGHLPANTGRLAGWTLAAFAAVAAGIFWLAP